MYRASDAWVFRVVTSEHQWRQLPALDPLRPRGCSAALCRAGVAGRRANGRARGGSRTRLAESMEEALESRGLVRISR